MNRAIKVALQGLPVLRFKRPKKEEVVSWQTKDLEPAGAIGLLEAHSPYAAP